MNVTGATTGSKQYIKASVIITGTCSGLFRLRHKTSMPLVTICFLSVIKLLAPCAKENADITVLKPICVFLCLKCELKDQYYSNIKITPWPLCISISTQEVSVCNKIRLHTQILCVSIDHNCHRKKRRRKLHRKLISSSDCSVKTPVWVQASPCFLSLNTGCIISGLPPGLHSTFVSFQT